MDPIVVFNALTDYNIVFGKTIVVSYTNYERAISLRPTRQPIYVLEYNAAIDKRYRNQYINIKSIKYTAKTFTTVWSRAIRWVHITTQQMCSNKILCSTYTRTVVRSVSYYYYYDARDAGLIRVYYYVDN